MDTSCRATLKSRSSSMRATRDLAGASPGDVAHDQVAIRVVGEVEGEMVVTPGSCANEPVNIGMNARSTLYRCSNLYVPILSPVGVYPDEV